jgi:hypothetical protein
MNIHTLYIDASEEITSVIERLKSSHDPIVALVVPKGGPLIQSIVNLKLIRKAAQDAAKDVILVTTDKIGRNLATQVGISVATNEKEIGKVASGAPASPSGDDEANVIAGVRIHRYYTEEEPGVDETANAPEALVIVPKTLLQPEQPTAVAPEAVPVVMEPAVEEKPDVTLPDSPVEEVVLQPATPIPVEQPAITRKNIDPVVEEVPPVVAVASAAPTPKTPMSVKRKRIILASSALALLLIAAIAVSFLFFPTTRVVLAIQAQPLSQDVTFTAKVGADTTASTTLPAETLHQEGESTVSFNATGTKDVGTVASGTVTFRNYSTTSSITVLNGTIVTSSGKTFATTSEVVVPGYTQPPGKDPIPGTKEAPITASTAGADSNLTNAPASNITANGAVLSFNTVTTSGGTTKQITVVTATDIANAKTAVTKQLQEELGKKMTDAMNGRDLRFAENSDIFATHDFTTTQAADTEASTAQATIKGALDRLVVDAATVKDAAAKLVQDQQAPTETRLIESTELTSITFNKAENSLNIAAKVTGKITPVFTTATIPQNIKGKDVQSAEQFLRDTTPASNVTIEQKPTWWPLKRLPTFSRFITVDVAYE